MIDSLLGQLEEAGLHLEWDDSSKVEENGDVNRDLGGDLRTVSGTRAWLNEYEYDTPGARGQRIGGETSNVSIDVTSELGDDPGVSVDIEIHGYPVSVRMDGDPHDGFDVKVGSIVLHVPFEHLDPEAVDG